MSAALTTFSLPYENKKVLAALNEHFDLYPRTIGHDLNAVRVSTHIYNTMEEVEMMIDAIAHISEHGVPEVSAAAYARAQHEMDAIERFCV